MSLNNTQDEKERKSRKNYYRMDFPLDNYRTPPFRKRARNIETSLASFSDDRNSRRSRYEKNQLMVELRNIKPPTFDGGVK